MWEESLVGRYTAIVGDLTKPKFGMSEEEFNALKDKTDAIYHNGAMVHWVYPYSKLKAMNVSPTLEILRMAIKADNISPVHFVSSTSVFDR